MKVTQVRITGNQSDIVIIIQNDKLAKYFKLKMNEIKTFKGLEAVDFLMKDRNEIWESEVDSETRKLIGVTYDEIAINLMEELFDELDDKPEKSMEDIKKEINEKSLVRLHIALVEG